MLDRIGIRRKLALLLVIPVMAVLATMAPLIWDRVSEARSAGATARAGEAARDIGVLIQDLQLERLLSMGFLTTPQMDRSALATQVETAVDEAARLTAAGGTASVMRAAAPALAALSGIRDRVISREADLGDVYSAYRNADAALLDALRLTNPPGVDATGLRQLGALDGLMRADEEATSGGALLVALASGRSLGSAALSDALSAQQQDSRRFRLLASAAQITLLDLVEQGKTGQQINALATAASASQAGASPAAVGDVLTVALSYTQLRRVAQDRIAREISTAGSSRAAGAEAIAVGVGAAGFLLLLVVVWVGVVVGRSISRPLGQLTAAATAVADLAGAELSRVADSEDVDQPPPRFASVPIRGGGEIGTLAAAFNRVQATAGLLVERQLNGRRNVAVMFANIARRTQSLVGRQHAVVRGLNRYEWRAQVVDGYRQLDHLAARLRRSADSLLVVSGTVDAGAGGTPMALADVIVAATAEIEDASAVQVGRVDRLMVSAGFVADLRLLLAELLENATSFSPPGVPVEVSARDTFSGCQLTVLDHGLGMTPERMEEENRRLIERERLDISPTAMLGLFVVGRLARRRGLTVRLDHSEGGGVTVTVSIPGRLFAPLTASLTLPPAAREHAALPAGETDGGFDWFTARRSEAHPVATDRSVQALEPADGRDGRPAAARQQPVPHPPAAEAPGAVTPPVPESRGGLNRRTPGARLSTRQIPEAATPPAPARDAIDEQARIDAFMAGANRANGGAPEAEPGQPDPHPQAADPERRRGGLNRRVPGAQLASSVARTAAGLAGRAEAPRSDGPAPSDPAPTGGTGRDPDTERAQLNRFLTGFARGSDTGTGEAESISEGQR
jgi:signal transduction histidine kinase